MFLGVGLGGFLDGILFHQILQLHGMLSARFPKTSVVNLEINMFWDGLFHAFTWIMTVIGLWLLWQAAGQKSSPGSGKILWGALLLGWGLFNLTEGILDHHLLQLHHVVERLGPSIYDYVFLGLGLALVVAGISIIRAGLSAARPE